jgi:hypothetical protein
VLPFVKPAAVRIGCADFDFFFRSAARFSGRWIIVIVILVLQRLLSVSNPVFIDLFLQLLFIEQRFLLNCFLLQFVAVGTRLYMGGVNKHFTRINQTCINTFL